MNRNAKTAWLISLVGLYVASEIISQVTAGRLVQLGGLVLPGATFLYALTFTLRDAIHVVGGYRVAKALIPVGLSANALVLLYGALVSALPHPSFFDPSVYASVLGTTFRVVAASLTAYFVSTWADTLLFERFRQTLAGRVVLSNVASTALDAGVFITIAFFGTGAPLLTLMGSQFIVKFAISLVLVPLVYGARASLRRAGFAIDY